MVMSLDGFVTSPDGTHEWMFEFFGDDSREWNRRALAEAGVHAMGRRSYEIMGPYWAASDGPIAKLASNESPYPPVPAVAGERDERRRPAHVADQLLVLLGPRPRHRRPRPPGPSARGRGCRRAP